MVTQLNVRCPKENVAFFKTSLLGKAPPDQRLHAELPDGSKTILIIDNIFLKTPNFLMPNSKIQNVIRE
jgi:hypothetical protein